MYRTIESSSSDHGIDGVKAHQQLGGGLQSASSREILICGSLQLLDVVKTLCEGNAGRLRAFRLSSMNSRAGRK